MRALVLLLALSLCLSGCSAGALVQAEKAVHRSLVLTTTTANGYCDAPALLEDAEAKRVRCRQFNVDVIPVATQARTFAEAILEGHGNSELYGMTAAMLRLRDIAWQLLPEGTREFIRAKLESVHGRLVSLGGNTP